MADYDWFDSKPDPYNYSLVHRMGFTRISASSMHLVECPSCYCVVDGQNAVHHWEAMHGA